MLVTEGNLIKTTSLHAFTSRWPAAGSSARDKTPCVHTHTRPDKHVYLERGRERERERKRERERERERERKTECFALPRGCELLCAELLPAICGIYAADMMMTKNPTHAP